MEEKRYFKNNKEGQEMVRIEKTENLKLETFMEISRSIFFTRKKISKHDDMCM
jgi:hypothetical protein